MSKYIEAHSTAGSLEEAEKICAAVVETRLAAYAQVVSPVSLRIPAGDATSA